MKVTITALAENDVLDAAYFYSEKGLELPFALFDDLNHAYQLISENSEIGSLTERGNRKVLLRRFPYAVIYRVETSECLVLAVSHYRRHPQHWVDR